MKDLFSRRQAVAGMGAVIFCAGVATHAEKPKGNAKRESDADLPRLAEHGFWDYTTPYTGGMEKFARDDYMRLLDDMADARMNSLMICVKWLTTGYRSRLPFLDQLEGNIMIESDNRLLHQVIEAAAARSIRVWLGAVVSIHVVAEYGGRPYQIHDRLPGNMPIVPFGMYDPDMPEFTERAVAIAEELVELFPGIHGLEIELEFCGRESPHRIAPYEAWARETGRKPFAELGHPFNPRVFDVPEWRDYTTHRRIEVLHAIESAVRSKGFKGNLATIFENSAIQYAVGMEVNLRMFRQQCPNWIGITYEHDKWNHRYANMDLNVATPKELGITVYNLPRGVMTWCDQWPMPMSIEEHWRMDIEDIRLFRPDGVWWFGAGTKSEGAHASLSRLREMGFTSGEAARRALLTLLAKAR